MTKPTPEHIRKEALSEIQNYPYGIKQSDFWVVMGQMFIDKGYEVGDSTIKNALWRLDQQHPEAVVKVRKSAKEVVLYPARESESIKKSNEIAVEEAEAVIDEVAITLSTLWVEFEKWHFSAVIEEVYTQFMKDFKEPSDVEALINLKIGMDLISKSHSHFKSRHQDNKEVKE